jgi:hypothetical protein
MTACTDECVLTYTTIVPDGYVFQIKNPYSLADPNIATYLKFPGPLNSNIATDYDWTGDSRAKSDKQAAAQPDWTPPALKN